MSFLGVVEVLSGKIKSHVFRRHRNEGKGLDNKKGKGRYWFLDMVNRQSVRPYLA